MNSCEIQETHGDLLNQPTDLLVLTHCQGEALTSMLSDVNERLGGALAEAMAQEEFSGKKKDTWLVHTLGKMVARRILLVGLGPRAELGPQGLREAMGRVVQKAEALKVRTLLMPVPDTNLGNQAVGQALAEGAILGSWRFEGYQKEPKKRTLPVVSLGSEHSEPLFTAGLERGRSIAEAQNVCRDLGVRPSNMLYPEKMAEEAKTRALAAGLEVEVFNAAKLQELGMGALLAVGQGSIHPPCMVILRYRGGGERTLGLVGKGITFDSGGISLKPAQGMEEMKYDMLGAGAVLSAMLAIARERPPINVVGILCIAQNIPSGSSYKPGDVVRAFNGKTIEIINTDAEGRVAMSDGVSYAVHLGVDWIAEASTLTGAAIIVLGHEATALVATDDALADAVMEASTRAGERTWRLPIYPEYRALYESPIADMKNAAGRDAGTITAGMIVSEFAGSTPFAHLDIAGTAWTKAGPLNAEFGPTGVATRTFVELATLLAEKSKD